MVLQVLSQGLLTISTQAGMGRGWTSHSRIPQSTNLFQESPVLAAPNPQYAQQVCVHE